MILLNIKYQNKPKGTKYGLMIHTFGGKTVRKSKEFWLVVTLVGGGQGGGINQGDQEAPAGVWSS